MNGGFDMFIAVLETKYQVYAIGETKEEAEKNLLKGYKKSFPKDEREFENPKSAEELIEHFGGGIYQTKNGFAIQ